MAVEGRFPDALGGVWLPSTAVGEVGTAEAGATTELGVAAGCVGPDCAGEGDEANAEAVADDDALCVAAGALCVAVGNGLAVLGAELGLA